jgi:hypothetical protein
MIIRGDVLFETSDVQLSQTSPPTDQQLNAFGIIKGEDGALTIRGRAACLFDNVNREIKALAKSLSAEEFVLPSSLSMDNLKRSGYSERFPQFATYLTAHGQTERACCSAVCLGCYPHFAGSQLAEGNAFSITALGKVFRHESAGYVEPERLSEFNMREIIFFGSSQFVSASLTNCYEWLKSLLLECRIRGSIELAQDPFFCAEADVLSAYQRTHRSKLEMRLEKPGTKERVATASVNNHDTHFAKAFDIRFKSGEFIHTGCFGLGFERFLFAIVNQFGADESRWPEGLKKRIF